MSINIRANLTLIFSVNKKNPNLQSVLESIEKQTDKNFSVIFAINNASLQDKEIISKFTNDSKGIDTKVILFTEALGDSYTFNYCLGKVQTKYVYYLDSNICLKPDFIATINQFVIDHPDTDVLSFFSVPNFYFKEKFLEIKRLSDDFCTRPLVVFNNKILNAQFLLKNKIREPIFSHCPLTFYVELYIHKARWYSIGRQICTIPNRYSFPFNIMDLYSDCENLANLIHDKRFEDLKSEIEYLILIGLLRNFVFAYFSSTPGKLVGHKKVLENIASFLSENLPDWRRNEWLWSKKNLNDSFYLDYLRDFKPKTRYVIKEMKSIAHKLRTSGHDIK